MNEGGSERQRQEKVQRGRVERDKQEKGKTLKNNNKYW